MSTPNPFAAPEPPPGPEQAPPAGYPPPYGQPAYGPPASYGPPPQPGQLPQAYGHPAAPRTDGTAIAVLVLAICSFLVLPVIPAVVALVLAPSADRAIAASGGRRSGDGLVRAGRVIAWVHLGLCLLGVVLLLGALVLFSAGFA